VTSTSETDERMSEKKVFLLPDLGEGLPDAEIVEWHVKVGDTVRLDEPLVSMETAKAVVDVPAPCSGKVLKLAGGAGDIVATGAMLAEFELDASLPQRAEAQDTGHHHGGAAKGAGQPVPDEPSRDDGDATTVHASDVGGELLDDDEPAPQGAPGARADAGTVVGAMQSSDRVHVEAATSVGGVRAMPAVRALAKKLGVDLARVVASGAGGVITLGDVKQAALLPSPSGRRVGDEGSAQAKHQPRPEPSPAARRAPPSPEGKGQDRVAAGAATSLDQDEPIRGVRRNMVRSMSAAHAEVVPTTLMDDADLHAWSPGEDTMARLIRALVVGARAEPALNSWLNAKEGTLRRHSRVHVGIAVDSPEGLFVPALRDAQARDAAGLRAELNRLRDGVKQRSLAPEELRDYTMMLSNFGVFAGKYATPIVVPPCVCIVGAGRLHHAVVPVLGGLETHRVLPLSLTFDHRACTGGEAARFLKAVIDDLQRAR
jgi:2-oxoisovalerate dehydrogenase E2 component (dihydrolipoyl transacylase)